MVIFDPAIRVISSEPVPDPPAERRITFSEAIAPSAAEILYVVFVSGVEIVPPRFTVDPLIVIPGFNNALFGILVRVFTEPEIIQVSKVLFVII